MSYICATFNSLIKLYVFWVRNPPISAITTVDNQKLSINMPQPTNSIRKLWSYQSLCGSSYHRFVTIIPKWRIRKTVRNLIYHFIGLYRILVDMVDMVDVWLYSWFTCAVSCLESVLYQRYGPMNFFIRLIVTDRLVFDQMIATAVIEMDINDSNWCVVMVRAIHLKTSPNLLPMRSWPVTKILPSNRFNTPLVLHCCIDVYQCNSKVIMF